MAHKTVDSTESTAREHRAGPSGGSAQPSKRSCIEDGYPADDFWSQARPIFMLVDVAAESDPVHVPI